MFFYNIKASLDKPNTCLPTKDIRYKEKQFYKIKQV